MATCIEVADAAYPQGGNIEPLMGKSLVPFFNETERDGHEEIYFEFGGCRALRKGDWKLVSFYKNRWELYNIANDRCEQNDLAEQHPEKVAALSARWHELAVDMDRLSKKKAGPVSDEASPESKGSWHKPSAYKNWKMPAF